VDAEHTKAFSGYGFPEGLPLIAPLDFSFCRYVVGYGRPFLVQDARNDPRTIDDPAIDAFSAVAWIGFPLQDSHGNILRNFCLMASEPREWTPLDVQTVATLAQAAGTEIALRQERAGRCLALPYRDTGRDRKSLPGSQRRDRGGSVPV
jgi:GAF domain-containing protein